MSDFIIRVENLGKKFIIGHQRQERYTTLRDEIVTNVKNIFHKTKDLINGKVITVGEEEEFWALQNVSFDIKHGDRVGIIGRNGAGKSTLLKILSRITEPTKGSITIQGRIAALLEVGTGFHPELTGRENIYLNGAILGMSSAEVKRKFDEIVDFAEVEKFLDTPVKRFSSGMYVRLAFAVAAHLEPEILIVDEVLAVGDLQFQKKCLGKMEEVSKSDGRTIIFVSHNMQAIQELCSIGIMLERGKVVAQGSMSKVIESYINNNTFSIATHTFKSTYNSKAYAHSLFISDLEDNPSVGIPFGKPWKITIDFIVNEPVTELILGLGMISMLGVPVRTVWQPPKKLKKGKYRATFIEDTIMFSSGTYKLVIGITERGQTLQYIDEHIIFNISDAVSKNINNVIDTSNGILLNSMKMNISLLETANNANV